LEATGLKRTEALKEIRTEFADINKIADEMSLDKKKEVFEIQYMSFRHFVTRPRAAIYTLLGVIALFGLIVSGLSYLTSGKIRSEEHTSELQSRFDLVCRLLLEKKKI